MTKEEKMTDVPSSGTQKPEDSLKNIKDTTPAEKKKDATTTEDEEMSEEDKALKEELEMLVERLVENNTSLHKAALEAIRTSIRTATSSMTAVPKPLKFLRPNYQTLIKCFESWKDGEDKKFLSDILSVLAMTYSEDGNRDSLKYHMSGMHEATGSWGHEFVRHLAGEVAAEYNHLIENGKDTSEMVKIGLGMVPFFLKHNAEADACDLLLELEIVEKIVEHVDKDNYSRVCLYIINCAPYVAPPDDITIYKTAHAIYRKVDKLPDALQISIRLRDMDMINADLEACQDASLKKQLAFMLGRALIPYETEDEELQELLSQSKLSEHFMNLGRDLEISEAKTPEDIYKSHLENTKSGYGVKADSAKQNLASSFVNAFVNAGFGTDKLILNAEDSNAWIYKNKDTGMMSAAASLGMILLWDVENAAAQIDKYTYADDDHVKAGALMGIGIASANTRHESDPALAILSEYVNSSTASLRLGSIYGLGVAYAGSAREDLLDILLPLVADTGLTMELSAHSALALGMIFVGTCNGDICSSILQAMMEREEKDLRDAYAKFMGLALALLFMGKQDAADATIETLKVIEAPLARQIEVLVEVCAFAGTGNVLKIQKMLHICNDHLDAEKKDDKFQAFAVLGIALIAMGEDIGSEMALRAFNHLMHYGELVIRRAVPLALGLLCASNPLMNVLDLLSKYSHDHDQEVALNAILAMGLVGAGTNNARLAQMLRHLAAYYYKDSSALFLVRVAQGLVHMGKGTMTINPFYSNRFLMNPIAVSGLLTVAVAFTSVKNLILGSAHYFLFHLVPAMSPRMLITLDEELKSLPVTVRVGQAVDVVGQAGRPKTITGFQTHTTPVLLGYNERAEIATEEYIPMTTTLEGFVILKKNPDYMDEDKDTRK